MARADAAPALQQFLADVYWGDLDYLLLDLPPGTGDVAISLAQLLPSAELLVVTTPQLAAAEVAERAGAIVTQTKQRIAGRDREHVVPGLPALRGADGRLRLRRRRGRRGGAHRSSTGAQVPLLGQVPLDVRLREGGDNGRRWSSATRPRRPRCS